MSTIQEPPSGWAGILRHLGPGLIITASIVGSGELIVTTKLGADVGFTLLWFIILGCMIKVFVQVEMGRYAMLRGVNTLQALDQVPGPRWKVSWLFWMWVVMYIGTVFQVAGIVGSTAQIFDLLGANLPIWAWTVLVSGGCAILLLIGHYKTVQNVSTAMVAFFTLYTVFAVFALSRTEYAITSAQLVEGFSFRLTDDFTIAFAALGVIGVGASELIYYPYWCLEKGYARFVGPREDSDAWRHRAQGWMRVMKADAWVSLVIYTLATVAFYLLGAAVLNAKGLVVENSNLIPTLSHIYLESVGPSAYKIFLIGSFAVLFSTVYVASASNARLGVDLLSMIGLKQYANPAHRETWVKGACVILPAASAVIFLAAGGKTPVSLVLVGALAQGLILPFLAVAAIWFSRQEKDPALQPGRFGIGFLWASAIALGIAGIYQFGTKALETLKTLAERLGIG